MKTFLWGLAGLAGVLVPLASQAQNELLLPYTQPIFQASWSNAAVRPEHRFSVSIAPLSSLEFGVTNNAFQLSSIWKKRGAYYLVQPDLLLSQARQNRDHLAHAEAQVELVHFRMLWRDWNFWFGARNVTSSSLIYPTLFYELALEGNAGYVGKTFTVENLKLDAVNYNELTFGASWVSDEWVFGGRVSLLAGTFNVHTLPNRIDVTISSDKPTLYHHHLRARGVVYMSGIPKHADGTPKYSGFSSQDISGMKWFNFSNPGFSVAGAASWRPIRDVNLTFAFSDLGFITWGDRLSTLDMAQVDYNLHRMGDLSTMLYNKKLKWEKFIDRLRDVVKVDSAQLKNGQAYTTWLSPRFHLMGTYRVARQSMVGASLSATVHQGRFYPAATLSFQQSYSNLVHAQVAMSYNQRSFLNLGFGLVFTPGPVQMYLVSDNLLGIILPSRMRSTNLRVGINFVFGPLFENHKLTNR